MDSVVRSVLEYIQKQDGHQFSVLAGGAIRDEHFGLVPKDYDLFVPSTSPRQMEELKNSMIKDLGIEDVLLKGSVYENLIEHQGQKITSVYSFYYADKEFDLIGVKEDDDGDFGDEVINKFDYGINMLWHDGITKYESMRFQDDYYGRRLTLHNIKSLDGLPKAMERFNKFNEKLGGGFKFYCPKLTLKGEEEKKPWAKAAKLKPYMGETLTEAENDGWAENPIPTQVIMGGTQTVWANTPNTGVGVNMAQAVQGNTVPTAFFNNLNNN